VKKQNAIDALNHLLLAVDILPDDAVIVAVDVYGGRPLGSVHVFTMPPTITELERKRVSMECVRLITHINGVEVYSLVNEPVSEDA